MFRVYFVSKRRLKEKEEIRPRVPDNRLTRSGREVVQKEGTDIVYETEREVNKKQETIEFPGIDSRYVITEERKIIRLINPKNNTVYFRYSIYKGKDKIHKTKYIEPNKMVEVDLWNILERGEYNIIVSVDTRDIETNKQTTSVNFETVIEVVK